ncbi:MAG: hypothetical protein ABFR31_04395 [Thermodesulfobacteriota bacterium]
MKKSCSQYTPEDISMFVDNELSRDKHQGLVQHLEQCTSCSSLVKNYKTLSADFKSHTQSKISEIDSARVKQKLDKAIQNSENKPLKNSFGLFGKNTYLKLASIAAILMITLFTFQNKLFTPTGPSAIVKYVDTDFSSVMIIETQKEQHTIIWYSET